MEPKTRMEKDMIEYILSKQKRNRSKSMIVDVPQADVMYRVQDVVEGMPGGFFIYHANEDEGFICINREILRIFGCETEEEFRELTGNSFRGMIHPDDLEAVEKSILEQIETNPEKMDYVEYRIIRKDGEIRWVEDYGHHLHSETAGDIYYVFITDATEKLIGQMAEIKQMNTQLAILNDKNEQYKKALLCGTVAFFEVDLSEDRFIGEKVHNVNGKNQNLFEDLGLSSDIRYSEYVDYWSSHVEKEKQEEYFRFFNRERMIAAYEAGDVEQHYEYETIDTQGRKRVAHQIMLLGKSTHKQTVIALSITKDITEWVREREQLARTLEQVEKTYSIEITQMFSNLLNDYHGEIM